MNKLLLPLLVAPLALAACGTNLATQFDVSGTISGTTPTGNGSVKLALVGIGTNGVIDNNVAQSKLSLGDGTKFTVDLPANVGSGVYSIIAYKDTNGNDKYDVGEKATGLGAALTYTQSSNTWKQGNTVIRDGGKSVARLTTYNLSW